MQRYKIEYERFMQMQSDIELALFNVKNNDKDAAIRHLQFCIDMMQTEQDFYGKDMPIDKFRAMEQEALTA